MKLAGRNNTLLFLASLERKSRGEQERDEGERDGERVEKGRKETGRDY